MPFTGDLEHLSIIDVVQLLHAARKSGTLTVTGGKGQCQLVFDDGFITSANHFDNSLRIGRILVEARALTESALGEALREQAAAGGKRRPLVAMLIESGRVKREEAYRGLETLLELTIVEVLTWNSGSFTLDVGTVAAADDYRYFPEKLNQGIQFHTENVLMDALRIYDEKKRDGTLAEVGFAGPPSAWDQESGAVGVLSANDLGLADVEGLERRISGVFTALEDSAAGGGHRGALDRLAPELGVAGRGRLAALLEGLPPRAHRGAGAPLYAVIYSGDELLTYCLAAACRHEGISVFATSEEKDIDAVVEHCRAKGGVPALVLDAPAAGDPRFSREALAALRRRTRERHRHLCMLQLSGPGGRILPDEPTEGVVAVLAHPRPERGAPTFVEDFAAFLATLPARLGEYVRDQRDWCVTSLSGGLAAVRELRDAPAVPLALLNAVAGACDRALTLVVRGSELIPERGIGFSTSAGREPQLLAGQPLRIPLGEAALLADVLERGRCRWVPAGAGALELLLARIGAPRHPEALLVPLCAAGRGVSLTYADFGQGEAAPVDLDLLEILAAQAGLKLESILYRARAEKHAPRKEDLSTNRHAGASPWT
jgi:hypothetical protein